MCAIDCMTRVQREAARGMTTDCSHRLFVPTLSFVSVSRHPGHASMCCNALYTLSDFADDRCLLAPSLEPESRRTCPDCPRPTKSPNPGFCSVTGPHSHCLSCSLSLSLSLLSCALLLSLPSRYYF